MKVDAARCARVMVLLLVWATGCATLDAGEGEAPAGWPEAVSGEALLAPLLECEGPGAFLARQEGVDMPRLVARLDAWHAVRLGALGPVREDAAGVLNGQRAAFLVRAQERYGAAAEVLALFVLHTCTDEDVREVLGRLARDKVLEETLGHLPAVQEELARRGLRREAYPEREERAGDVVRGLGRAARDALASSPVSDGARAVELSALREHLPPPYQRALDAVEREQRLRHFAPERVGLGSVDALTFGVPLGFHGLVVGTVGGVSSLGRGQYERAARELAPGVLMAALYAGGRTVGRGDTVAARMQALREVARELEARLGAEGLRELGRELQATREAGRWVAAGGVDAAVVLHEARGDAGKARAWMTRAHRGRPGAALVDEALGLTAEVLEAKWAGVEGEATGARLARDAAALEKRRPSREAPPRGAQGHPRWAEYVAYYEKRLAEVREGRAEKGPLTWEAYEPMRGGFARGLAFERAMVERLRADALLPRARRRYLGDFEQPRIETYVGVWKPQVGLRFADVLVLEQASSAPGTAPRVETFSFKSRNLTGLAPRVLTNQMKSDAKEALTYYGETLDVRRSSLKSLLNGSTTIPVLRVRLFYEGGGLRPPFAVRAEDIIELMRTSVPGVEVFIQ
ncbi:hypothetical protein [Melittangium boletus]|uniref:hypothetical protein n=1 Tax=Melittangium boletus TaxID=83453 RepID=UPI003DA29609